MNLACLVVVFCGKSPRVAAELDQNSAFVDLGSGLGRPAMLAGTYVVLSIVTTRGQHHRMDISPVRCSNWRRRGGRSLAVPAVRRNARFTHAGPCFSDVTFACSVENVPWWCRRKWRWELRPRRQTFASCNATFGLCSAWTRLPTSSCACADLWAHDWSFCVLWSDARA